ncbi:hypothetical protein GCM10008955_26420 [Deinococcus malanensis]|uniref:Uncharacterized protein n=1 Tax=Deinococcus malanensis TaxID=1706855 RepID=A0ABQ2EXJ3_9DEIO|nr:hypothetical protein [Deinococcus malanensis]GGK31253.1 hypothetical protein GCM10008955_26420 [Deinococcus malanensis]
MKSSNDNHILILSALIAWLAWPILFGLPFAFYKMVGIKFSELGQYGDMYGGFNAIITVVTALVVISSFRRDNKKDEQQKWILYGDLIERIARNDIILNKIPLLVDRNTGSRYNKEYIIDNNISDVLSLIATASYAVTLVNRDMLPSEKKSEIERFTNKVYNTIQKNTVVVAIVRGNVLFDSITSS